LSISSAQKAKKQSVGYVLAIRRKTKSAAARRGRALIIDLRTVAISACPFALAYFTEHVVDCSMNYIDEPAACDREDWRFRR